VRDLHRRLGSVHHRSPRGADGHRIPRISFEEMLEIAATGGRVLALRSVEFARNHHVTLHVRSSFTWEPGTVVSEEDSSMEQPIVSAVTSDSTEAKITITGVPDQPGIAASVFRGLADRAINVDVIVQNTSHHGTTDISFTVPARTSRAVSKWPSSSSPNSGRYR